MRRGRYLWGINLGSLISFAGLVLYLWEGREFNDFGEAFKSGTGYLFLVSGLVMVLASVLMMLSEERSE